jgi:hypothetical protein
MSDDVPFAVRRGELLDRAVAILSTDARFPAGWLEGSLLASAQRDECARLVERIETSVRNADRAAMRDLHIEIHRQICRLAAAAFARHGLEFPPRVEREMIEFYKREWPL